MLKQGIQMAAERNSTSKSKEEISEQDEGVKKLVETLIQSFLRSDSDYGAITDINTDISQVYQIVRDYISCENLDIYALKLEDRILLSRTNVGFEDLYEVVKSHSQLQMRQNMVEIWDDPQNKILHLIIMPIRKHFPIEYSTEKEKTKMVEEFSSMTMQINQK